MQVFRSLDAVPVEPRGRAVCIGNFDGVHEGHKHLFRRNIEFSGRLGCVPSVLTFDPHPTRVVAPDRAPRLLTTVDQRIGLMADVGLEQVIVLPFDRTFSQIGPEDFVQRVLIDALQARAVLVGDNFRFGTKQAGDTALLRQLGAALGFEVEIVPSITVRGRTASSTAVRELITAGDVSKACRLLGRPYSVEGQVVRGHGIGSKQTVPTLNLDTDAEVLPAQGVYITRTHDLDSVRTWQSITNVGYRPTFGGDELTIETFLLEPLHDPTPARIRVEFLRRVREERKFDSPDALKAQILRDVGRANAWFRRCARSRIS